MKIRHYEVIDGVGCYIIRWQDGKASGFVARTDGNSRADRRIAMLLVEQANHAAELLEALKSLLHDAQDRFTEVPSAVYHKAVDAIAKAESRNSGGK